MKASIRNFARGHIWAAVIAAMAALGCGVAIGYLAGGAPKGPSMQSVIDSLAKPVPAPNGTKLLAALGEEHQINVGAVDWQQDFVLDITALKDGEYQEVSRAFVDCLINQFTRGNCGFWARQSLVKSDSGFGLSTGIDPGLCIGYDDYKHFNISVDAQVIDFEPNLSPYTRSKRQAVLHWFTPPVYGQRVLWLRVHFHGRGLSGKGKWPQSPSSMPTSATGS